MGPSLEEERRRHRTARTVAVTSVAAVVGIVLLVWVVGLLGHEVVQADVAPAAASGGPSAVPLQAAGPPNPQLLAEAVVEEDEPGLRLQLPINRAAVTGIGFGPRRERGVVELQPSGQRANLSWGRRIVQRFLSTSAIGDLRWFRLGDGTAAMVTVGAAPGTDLYAPLDGTVIAIAPYELSGETHGSIVQLQPLGDGQTVVVLRNLDVAAGPDALAVGQKVSEGSTLIGHVRDLRGAADAPLADYTHNSGSGVQLYVVRVEADAQLGG